MRIAIVLCCVAVVWAPAAAQAPGRYPETRIAPGITVIHGPVNGVVVERGGQRLTIYGDPRAAAKPEMVLFTHYRRDVIWAGRRAVTEGARAVAPEKEKPLFDGAEAFWERQWTARFHDYALEGTKVAGRSLPVARTVREGDVVDWQGMSFRVLDTPGYTPGAVSYLLEADGKRLAFTGDLIYAGGRLIDLYSLQDAIPEAKARGYHGYAARAGSLLASLRKVAVWKPDMLVPARGPVIRNPEAAMGKLRQRLEELFASHFSTDALRWYWGDDNLRTRAAGVLGKRAIPWMEMAGTVRESLPDWLASIGNSRLIISRSGAAFLVDAGYRKACEELRKLREQARFQRLEGIFITHYHDDHTDYAQETADEYGCRVFTVRQMEDILRRPGAYRMPALTANAIRSLEVVPEGAARRWHEFTMTYSYFPGQTLYHAGLEVRKDGGETVFFTGDSFTPSGMDDYCLWNRNLLAPAPGYPACFRALRKLPPDNLLVNQHVAPVFRFSAAQLEFMEKEFARRATILKELFPWDHPNYGLDSQWARLDPYGVSMRAGSTAELRCILTHPGPGPARYTVTLNLPEGWKGPAGSLTVAADAGTEASVTVPISAPQKASGLFLITADVTFGRWELKEWAEALVRISD